MSLPDAGNGQLPSRRIGGEDLSDLALDWHFLKQLIQDLLSFLTGVARLHALDYIHRSTPLPWPLRASGEVICESNAVAALKLRVPAMAIACLWVSWLPSFCLSSA